MSQATNQSANASAPARRPIVAIAGEVRLTKRKLELARKHLSKMERARDRALNSGKFRKAQRISRLIARSHDGRLVEVADTIRANGRECRAPRQTDLAARPAPPFSLGTHLATERNAAALKDGIIRPDELLIGNQIVETERDSVRAGRRGRPMSLRDAARIASTIHLGRAPRAKYTVFPVSKSDGTFRPMHAFSVADKARQKLLVRAYRPLLAHDSRNYAAPGRGGRAAALEAVLKAISDQHSLKWASHLDIKNCFQSINREWLKEHLPVPTAFTTSTILLEDEKEKEGRLMERADGTPTKTRARLKYSGLGLMGISSSACHLWISSRPGLPQGAATSSAIAAHVIAIVLRSTALPEGVLLVIYADDMLVLGATRLEVEQAIKSLRGAFKSHSAGPFEMHCAKPKTVATGISFLGTTFKRIKGQAWCEPDKAALQRARGRISLAATDVEVGTTSGLAFGRTLEGIVASLAPWQVRHAWVWNILRRLSSTLPTFRAQCFLSVAAIRERAQRVHLSLLP